MMTVAEVAEMVRLTASFEGKTVEEAWEENTADDIKSDYNLKDILEFLKKK